MNFSKDKQFVFSPVAPQAVFLYLSWQFSGAYLHLLALKRYNLQKNGSFQARKTDCYRLSQKDVFTCSCWYCSRLLTSLQLLKSNKLLQKLNLQCFVSSEKNLPNAILPYFPIYPEPFYPQVTFSFKVPGGCVSRQ